MSNSDDIIPTITNDLNSISTDTNIQSEDSSEAIAPPIEVMTDQTDYAPESVAIIAANNITVGGAVEFEVIDKDTSDGIVAGASSPWIVVDGSESDQDGLVNGSVVTSWKVNQDALNQSFILMATDLVSGSIDTTEFTDGPKALSTPVVTSANLNPAPGLDLTTAQSSGIINGALFQEVTGTGDGSGTFDSFLRVNGAPNDTDGSVATEEGFNTDGTVSNNKSPLDDINGVHTHSIILSDVPIVTVGGLITGSFA